MTKEPIKQLERWIFIEQQIAVFCETDDFCKAYEEYCHHFYEMDSLAELYTTYICDYDKGIKMYG